MPIVLLPVGWCWHSVIGENPEQAGGIRTTSSWLRFAWTRERETSRSLTVPKSGEAATDRVSVVTPLSVIGLFRRNVELLTWSTRAKAPTLALVIRSTITRSMGIAGGVAVP